MSKITIALESAVARVKASSPPEGEASTARQRAEVDRAFAHILRLIAPRIRHFIRQYGLAAHWDDAEQACSIAVHRAIQAYDSEKAQFTTFVNWQIRGELQSLRFRLMTDQRPSARKVEAVTVSLDAIGSGEDGEDISIVASIEDEEALDRTEAAASDYLARAAMVSLADTYVEHLRKTGMERLRRQARSRKGRRAEVEGHEGVDGDDRQRRRVWRAESSAIDPADLAELEERLQHNRKVVEHRLFELLPGEPFDDDSGVMRERARQIAKRAARTMCELAGLDPRFAMMAEYGQALSAH
ncbi:sigma-70 family RNA polymerase sigma factor [Novosphingobium clariflavum]|uniref:Sigma-70 family RNA polymerase sigma factor n=1 Tax=Novosphingobium clariflavum TaxID=2029884 RepID=A0ABV6SB90_9SPHN|nr:sigma-70 family RNA polymerase sigma factor [Novosphingobium clariflavum]